MNGATLRLAYDNGKKLDNISAFTKEAHQISDEAVVVKTTHSGKYYHLHMWVKSELEKTPQSEERVKAKNYYKMATYRLFNKAKANIKAVEKGMFGEGH